MAVSNENTRILITYPKDIKPKLEKKAKAENRSVSNYVLNLILKDVESSK
jgi:tartrate dehydratase alpha subunit/fumarate hydratase class I-like protein